MIYNFYVGVFLVLNIGLTRGKAVQTFTEALRTVDFGRLASDQHRELLKKRYKIEITNNKLKQYKR